MADDELKCPSCGAKVYLADAQCLSCGARLDEGKLAAPGGTVQEANGAAAAASEDVPAIVVTWARVRAALFLSFAAWQLFWPLYSLTTRTAIKAVLALALPPWSTWGTPVRPLSGEWWAALGLGLFLAAGVVPSLVRYWRQSKQADAAAREEGASARRQAAGAARAREEQEAHATTEAREGSAALDDADAGAADQREPRPHYRRRQVAAFKRQFHIRGMVHQIGTEVWVGTGLLLASALEYYGHGEDSPMAHMVSEYTGIVMIAWMVAYPVFVLLSARCPACGRNMFLSRPMSRGLPSPCPHCGLHFR